MIIRMTEENDVVVAEASVKTKTKDGWFLYLVFCDVFEMRDGQIKKRIGFIAELTPSSGADSASYVLTLFCGVIIDKIILNYFNNIMERKIVDLCTALDPGNTAMSPRHWRAKLHVCMRDRLAEILRIDHEFESFSVLGKGDDAIVLAIEGTPLVARIAQAAECDPRPRMGEVLQPVDTFIVEGTTGSKIPAPDIRVRIFLRGVPDVINAEVDDLARSVACKGWWWREANTSNAIRLAQTGKEYIHDTGSLYPVSAIGRPVFGMTMSGDSPKPHTSFDHGGFPESSGHPLVRILASCIQRSAFAVRQCFSFRSPLKFWPLQEQLDAIPPEFRPGGAWHRRAVASRGMRESRDC